MKTVSKFVLLLTLTVFLFACSLVKLPVIGHLTPTPTEFATSTSVPIQAGSYEGASPEVYIVVINGSVDGFGITVPWTAGTDGVCKNNLISLGNGTLDFDLAEKSIQINPDGTFTFERVDSTTGDVLVQFKGVIEGTSAHGTYMLAECQGWQHDIWETIDTKLTGNWSAGLQPTKTPMPTLLPYIAGHYSGDNVRFDLKDGQVLNFYLTYGGCTISGELWGLDSRQGFFASSSDGQQTVSGTIEGNRASGSFYSSCGNGAWSATTP